MPPTATKWSSSVSRDMCMEYSEAFYGIVPMGRCFSCLNSLEAPKKIVIEHYQCPALPSNWVLLPTDAGQKFVDPVYFYSRYTPHEDLRWYKYPEELKTRCPDFHVASAGILGIPRKYVLENLQTLINFRPVFEGVRLLNVFSHSSKKSKFLSRLFFEMQKMCLLLFLKRVPYPYRCVIIPNGPSVPLYMILGIFEELAGRIY